MQATLDVELATTGLTFSDQQFALPEVPGALLLQIDSTTLKLTERRGSQTWQILRYPIALFPQRAGDLTVPPFDVRFAVSAGYGKAPRAFSFRTEPLTFSARLPEGVDAGALLVTTPEYDLSWSWSPAPSADDAEPVMVLAPGDAVTLTVTQRAADLSGMVLPELPIHRAAGLAAYPAAPEIEDRVARGVLQGTRTDEVTWMLEEEGRQSLPALRYRWFDPSRGTLRSAEVPGLELSVVARAGTQPGNANAASARSANDVPRWVLVAAAVLAGLAALLVWARRRGLLVSLSTRAAARRARRAAGEGALFRAVERACAADDARWALIALSRWQRCHPAPAGAASPVLLLDLARDQPEARRLLEDLQYAVVDERTWDGRALRANLPALRRRHRVRDPATRASALTALNPGADGRV
ncbi:MAG: hypothetical protein V2I63_00980 [Pseudomonadales bacterium]|jgi:hypothetical protein|nr:hypothetical protein [Pseudomonadales bacterium]